MKGGEVEWTYAVFIITTTPAAAASKAKHSTKQKEWIPYNLFEEYINKRGNVMRVCILLVVCYLRVVIYEHM